jgi:succinate dehydrogenase / fumarate reductase iron-sulfur subunit
MAELTLPKNSRIMPGQDLAERPAGATRLKEYRVYRYDPDSGENPRLDTYFVDTRRLRADGPRRPALDQEQGRPDADLSPLLPRGHLRLVRDEHRRASNTLACTKGMDDFDGAVISVYPLPHMPVIKDLVPDLTTFYASTARSSPG